MKAWEKSIATFVDNIKLEWEIDAILVCGSYVTGSPTKHSDIDVHLILPTGTEWRERGNKLIDGYLIEYFANPPQQIRKYFEEDHSDHSTMSMVQFITGKVIFDNVGIINILKKEAQQWVNKKQQEVSEVEIELMKYSLWDTLDNLLDCYEQERPDFTFIYYNSLAKLFNDYCKFLGLEKIPYYQVHSYLFDHKYLTKYLKNKFPDSEFSILYKKTIQESGREEMITNYIELSNHVLDKMGGFIIDGWSIRSSVE